MLLEGTVHDGAILLDDPAQLPEGAHVEIEVKTVTETKTVPTDSDSPPTLLNLLKLAGLANDLPEDFAAQHDHYLHGTPKR